MQRLSQKQFDEIYGRLGVKFDVALGESFYNPQLKHVVQQLRDRGIATESEGALCVFSDGSTKQEDDPFLIKDKDGWRMKTALREGVARYQPEILLTPSNNVILANLAAARQDEITRLFAAHGVQTQPERQGSLLRRASMACVALPTCGCSTTWSMANSASGTLGSDSNTSRPAAPRLPSARALTRAASSTTEPRATLISVPLCPSAARTSALTR